MIHKMERNGTFYDAPSAGFKPATFALEERYSIQLSYEGIESGTSPMNEIIKDN